MARRKVILAEGEIYHVYNRGVEKRRVFNSRRDYQRFIETIDFYLLAKPLTRFSFRQRPSVKKWQSKKRITKKQDKLVEINAFCLMPNHFHFLIKQVYQEGISTFIRRLLNSYTKYFNIKNKRSGPLFQGRFKAVRIRNNQELLHVSRYIHLNPVTNYLTKDLKSYWYSSYPEYLGLKEGFCSPEDVISQFKTLPDYEKFVLDHKDYARRLKDIEHLIDK